MKEGFFRNYELAQLSPLTRILFQGLWCLADKNGRLWDRGQQIKAECLPYDECEVEIMLTDLASSGFILRYKAGDRKCIQVVNFEKHQPLTTWEKNTSADIPAPKGFRRKSLGLQTENISASPLHSTVQNRSDQNSSGVHPPFHGAEFEAALLEFKQHRKEKRSPLTLTAERNLYLKLAPWGEDRAVAALRHSMAQGYTGVFEPSANGNSGGGTSKAARSQQAVDRVLEEARRNG